MAITNTGFAPKLLYPGINAIWGTKFKELPKQCFDLFDKFKSDRNFEEDVGMTGYGMAALKPQGESVLYDESKQTYVTRYNHAVYAIGFQITEEMMEDNLYKKEAYRGASDLAYSLNTAMETVAANVYNRAFNSSYTFGDGSALCVSTHATEAGNQSNVATTSADLSEASLEAMAIQVMNAKGPRGLRINLKPISLHISPSNVFEAERILKSVNQNDTANNALNALKSRGVFPKGAVVNHYFTDTDAWFVRTDIQPDYGMKMYMRHEPRMKMDNDTDTFNAKFLSYVRFSVGNTDYRAVYGNPGG
jgi:hypothetical protein